ncbi:MAG: hypothetical protein LBU23_11145 [Planctomycetota bacterium]|jgi:hypothetical protein|nr:hypothetical protein [Planctomycetota bacterium]
MVETIRPKLVEYHSPRPFILGVCFCCGMVAGFCLYLFRTPERPAGPPAVPPQPIEAAPAALPSELERRHQDTPLIAPVESAPLNPANPRPGIESMEIAAPAAIMTTEGGLTGKNARPINQPRRRSPAGQTGSPRSPPPTGVPPPLPDLMP